MKVLVGALYYYGSDGGHVLDEIASRDKRCRESDYRAIQRAYQYLGVFVESLSRLNVIYSDYLTRQPPLALSS